MAETSYIIQNGKRLNLKDATARSSIGSCEELETSAKHCLVHAINEVAEKVSPIINVNGNIIAENASVVSTSLFGEETALNPSTITVTDGGGKVTLSTEGLVFEDHKGNKKKIGGIEYIIQPDPNAVMFSEMEEYVEEAIQSVTIKTDETLTYENGVLSVKMADKVEDRTLPISAAAVNTTVGNIEVLLKTI